MRNLAKIQMSPKHVLPPLPVSPWQLQVEVTVQQLYIIWQNSNSKRYYCTEMYLQYGITLLHGYSTLQLALEKWAMYLKDN